MNHSIRAAREEDAQSITELLNPIIETGEHTIIDEPLSVDEQANWIRSALQNGTFHVAVSDDSGKLLGFQSIEPFSSLANSLKHVGEIATFVSPAAHRNGIGRSLSAATFRQAEKRGFRKIMATIRADNPQAIGFYRGQGFEVIGTARQHAFVQGRYIDEVITEKHLD